MSVRLIPGEWQKFQNFQSSICVSRNILLYMKAMKGRLSKIRSVHAYVIPDGLFWLNLYNAVLTLRNHSFWIAMVLSNDFDHWYFRYRLYEHTYDLIILFLILTVATTTQNCRKSDLKFRRHLPWSLFIVSLKIKD